MREVLNASHVARVIGVDPHEVRHKMRTGKWKFGKVFKPEKGQVQYRYEATIGEVARCFDLDREEVERRLRDGKEARS